MEGPVLIADALGRVNALLHRSLEGLSASTINQMPTPETSSMAWLAWHLTRVQDHHLSDLAGLPQLWTSAGWHAKFSMNADDSETGTGHSLQQVAAFKADSPDTLLAYSDAVYERSKAYLETLRSEDLDKEINEPQYNPLPKVGVRLVSVVSDNTQHAGQVAYLRGYFEGYGWRRV